MNMVLELESWDLEATTFPIVLVQASEQTFFGVLNWAGNKSRFPPKKV